MNTILDLIQTPLTLVRGPVGSGKTMYLARLAEDAYNSGLPLIVIGDTEITNRIEHFCPAAISKLTHILPESFPEIEAVVAQAPLNAVVLVDDFDYIGPFDPNNTVLGTAARRVNTLRRKAQTRCKVVAVLRGTKGLDSIPTIALKKVSREPKTGSARPSQDR